jgi:hypothetical protein
MIITLLFLALLQPPTSKVFTLEFNHDGLNTSTYEVSVDSVRSLISPTCVGSGDTRLCTSPLTLTLNTNHTVSVYAVGTFGETVSLPFLCAVPKVPANPKVK